ncbi:MAG: M28 family peptidase [Chloroflexi bacterium]|nr:M28 family peptidase [Chloroflexota bacterium]
MNDLRERGLSVLAALGRCPAAPLHEGAVIATLREHLARLGLPAETDHYGNLIAHLRRGEPAQRLALVAHTDHPAFEILDVQGGRAGGVLRGGVAAEYFHQAVPVRIVTAAGPIAGRIESAAVDQATGETRLDLVTNGPAAPGDFGVFDLVDFALVGDQIHMRAVDDLAGCAAIVLTLAELAAGETACDVYAVFTRAEEVGLVGATLLAQSGRLPPDTLVISLEASRALPGAEQGGGPVIRVGDARRAFDPSGEALLLAARRRLQATDPAARVQRQLLSGGTCEATAFLAYGYRATGMAFPLANYHNQGPAQQIAAEYIDVHDFVTGIRLLTAAVETAASAIVDDVAARLDGLAQTWAPRLRRHE